MANIQSAKVSVILDQPFFGALLCHLKFQEDTTGQVKTAATDGTRLVYSPSYVASLSHSELVGLLCHEVMHCAAGHPWRRDARDARQANIAMDMAINPLIAEAGMTLPQGGVMPADYGLAEGNSFEWYYDRIPSPPPDQEPAPGGCEDSPSSEPSQGPSNGDDSGQGDTEADGDSGPSMTEADWKEKVRQAAIQAKQRGDKSAGIDRFASQVTESKVDWKDVLRRFVQQAAKSDYTWTRPNSRYIGQDIYLPALHSEDMPGIAIAVDTSGSMDDIALAKAKAEVLAVIEETSPARVDVFYADARVARHDTFEKGDTVVFSPAGGGGTAFAPVFEAAGALEETPKCLIYISDLCGSFPDTDHGIPTLWVTDGDLTAPIGETIRIQY